MADAFRNQKPESYTIARKGAVVLPEASGAVKFLFAAKNRPISSPYLFVAGVPSCKSMDAAFPDRTPS